MRAALLRDLLSALRASTTTATSEIRARHSALVVAGLFARAKGGTDRDRGLDDQISLVAEYAYLQGVLDARAAHGLDRVELVWTGPVTGPSAPRSTRQVLTEIIAGSTRYVMLAGYRFSGPSADGSAVVDRVRAAAERSIRVTLIVDHDEMNRHALASVRWPSANLPRILTWIPSEGTHALLHAKITVVDDRLALITSANPTRSGLDRNIELGVLTHGSIALKLREHLAALERTGVIGPYDLKR
jgi:phosphatidylserine/phosphatidylglycerophosphate/cardiolipin synthase-like enzyme